MELRKLFSANIGKTISGESIAGKFGVSRIAVWKKINILKKTGYNIKSVKNAGYVLSEKPDVLDEERLKNWVRKKGNAELYGSVKYLFKTDSTQILAKKLAESGAVGSVIIAAEKQAKSYGRMGRKWYSPLGGLWFSALIRPKIMPQQATLLTLIFSLAVREVLQSSIKEKVWVKWPNDIYLRGKKICGILTELSAELDRTKWVVIGAGININNSVPVQLKNEAVSLIDIDGKMSDRTKIFVRILENFRLRYKSFVKSGFDGFRQEYRGNSIFLNERIKIKTTDNRIFAGRNLGIDENGFLVLEDGGKNRIVVPSGDII